MIAPARRASVDALQLIEAGNLDLGAAVAKVRVTLHDERDRSLLLEIVTGTLRMQGAIDYQLASRVKRPLARLDTAVLRVLRMSGFQLLYQSRVPASAVINDAVELTRRAGKTSAAGLTNAVLRALSRDRDALSWPSRDDLAAHLSVVHSHPRWLVERWLARYGADATEAWLRFNNEPPYMCLAVNRHLNDRDTLMKELAGAGVETRPTMRAAHGLVVIEGRALSTAAFTEGRFLVQDEASQLVGELAAAGSGARVFDLCASPGGKTLALSAAPQTSLIVASDVRAPRVRLLVRTVARCRVPNARVVYVPAAGPLPFADGAFDTVLVDAPCSGLGTVRRDPDIKWRRSAEDLSVFAVAQGELIRRAARLVRSGGTLVYATCSSEPEENGDVVAAFLAERPDYTQLGVHETLPFRDGLEAFFATGLRRA